MSPGDQGEAMHQPARLRLAPDDWVGTWAGHWSSLGDRAMRRGDADLESDRITRACASYLRAAQCYWFALGEPALGSGERRRLEDAHAAAFRAAVPGLPHAVTPFALAVGHSTVEGYLFLPVTLRRGVCTALWPVSEPATAESAYWHVAASMLDSGTGCVAFTSTSQRSYRRRPRVTAPIVDAVTSWARQQPGVHEVLNPSTPRAAPVPRGGRPRADASPHERASPAP